VSLFYYQGGEELAEGVAVLLVAKADYAASQSNAAEDTTSSGVSCSDALNEALKRMQVYKEGLWGVGNKVKNAEFYGR
jgi:hypothetical protein